MCSAPSSMTLGNLGVMFAMSAHAARASSMYLCNSVSPPADIASCWSKSMTSFAVLRKPVNTCSRRAGCMDNSRELASCGTNAKNVHKHNNLASFDTRASS